MVIITELHTPESAIAKGKGCITDLSLGGMGLYQPEPPLATGRELEVTFTLPQEGKVALRGIVVWTRESVDGRGGYQSGVRWLQIPPPAQARLNAFLAPRIRSPRSSAGISTAAPMPIRWWRVMGLVVIIGGLLITAQLFYTAYTISQHVQYRKSPFALYKVVRP